MTTGPSLYQLQRYLHGLQGYTVGKRKCRVMDTEDMGFDIEAMF